MLKYITSFFKFLAPIVRKAIIQVAADELSKVAYDRPARRGYIGRRTPYSNYQRRVPRQRAPRSYREMVATGQFDVETKGTEGHYHDVIMVAFDLSGPNAKTTHEWLHDNLPDGDQSYGELDEIYLDAWWVANDERYDRSDCDSAVFVKMGKQAEARALLREHGLVD